MMMLLILVLLNLLFVAGFIAYWVIEERGTRRGVQHHDHGLSIDVVLVMLRSRWTSGWRCLTTRGG
jgi:hypothetical protein